MRTDHDQVDSQFLRVLYDRAGNVMLLVRMDVYINMQARRQLGGGVRQVTQPLLLARGLRPPAAPEPAS